MLLACLLSFACPGGERAPEAFRYNISTEPPSLDWSIATDHSSIQVLDNIMEGLTRFDEDLHVQPALADGWSIMDGGSRYIFHLRRDALWTDGQPVTAHDFVYSWRRLVDPATAGEYAYFIYMVKNAREINLGGSAYARALEEAVTPWSALVGLSQFTRRLSGVPAPAGGAGGEEAAPLSAFKSVFGAWRRMVRDRVPPSALGVRALDDHRLEVELSRPVVFFPMITTFIATYPMRRDVVEKHGTRWTEPENIVTCGPYQLIEWRHEYRITLERNPLYYGSAGLSRIIFYMVNENSTVLSLYLTGELDAAYPLPPPAIPSYSEVNHPEFVNYPYLAIYYYGFNVKKPPVDDPLVRAALASAVDRNQLPQILKGRQVPTPGLIPTVMADYANPSLGHDYDPERARRLLAQAGYPGGRGFPRITIGYNTEESHKMIAEFVQQQWKDNLGVEAELRNMEWKVYLRELQHDPPHVFRLGWILDYPDPDAMMTVFTSDSANNHTRWQNQEYDRLVLRAALEPDPDKRKKLYDRAQLLICREETALIPLYTYTMNMLVNPRVKNFPQNAMNRLDLRDTRIERSAP